MLVIGEYRGGSPQQRYSNRGTSLAAFTAIQFEKIAVEAVMVTSGR
jgi:hypothetical protein